MTRRQWEIRVRECRGSGMTAKAWCKGKGISYSTYLVWAKRFRQEGSRTEVEQSESGRQWVSIAAPIKTEDGKEGGKPESISGGNVTRGKLIIIVSEGLQDGQMAELLRVVKESCC